MSYATVTELITRFGEAELIQLTDRDGGGAINQAVVAAALTDADALINGYVSARYTVPLSPVPPVITKIAADIARYTLHRDAHVYAGYRRA
jgi:phage gp36-like protein